MVAWQSCSYIRGRATRREGFYLVTTIKHSLRDAVTAALLLALACNGDDTPATSSDESSSTTTSVGTTTGNASTSAAASTSTADGSSSGGTSSSSSGMPDGSTSSESSGTTEAVELPGAELLLNHDGLARIDLTLDQIAIDSLYASSDTYVHADAEMQLPSGEVMVLPDIGVRLKGRYGSFRTLDQKAAFLLRFDQWDADQEPLGLEKLALNNMVQDPSMIHEQLAYMLFRDAGLPAPRSGYARVFVNDELYGLYATVEVIDNSEFLDLWYGTDEGNLYEGEYGSDLYDDWVSSFDLDNGTDVGFQDLQELTDAFDAMVDPATFLTDADAVIDVDRYVGFAATEIWLGHWDGYAWTRNNYFLYRGADTRWTFMPWGIDQTFWDYLPIWGGGGRVQQMCGASIPCRQALAEAFLNVSTQIDALQLVDYADVLLTLIDAAMQEDPRKEYDAGTVYWAIDMTQDFMLNRPGDVEEQLICADPTTIDEDGDGAYGCGFDCDDDDESVYPGAPEVCNFQDDDCNGVLDDDPMCPPCMTMPSPSGGTLAYCFPPRNHAAAEFDCVAQGGHLVSIHDQATQDEVRDTAYALMPVNWWIGLSDVALEGTFVWGDNTPLDYTAWAGGEPNNAGGNENCAHLWDAAGGQWNDIPCEITMSYVCRLP
jgi:CotH kinase protein/Lectin C-type domain/Putative metal-binding motif